MPTVEQKTKTDYDPISKDYKKSKLAPWRTFIEKPSFLGLIGDVKGLKVLDLACGEGHYSRILRDKGANVVGVDLSKEMIKLAKEQEIGKANPVTYYAHDASKISELSLGKFDLVVASYLLCYANDLNAMEAFEEQIRLHLKDKGWFITVTNNTLDIDNHWANNGHPSKYGFYKTLKMERGTVETGTITIWELQGERGFFSLENYWISREDTEAIFKRHFNNVEWINAKVEGDDLDNWKEFLDHPPIVCFKAQKK
jgi:SAM-dependent methyltransferase